MVKYNLVVDNYQLEFKNVYFDENSQVLRNEYLIWQKIFRLIY